MKTVRDQNIIDSEAPAGAYATSNVYACTLQTDGPWGNLSKTASAFMKLALEPVQYIPVTPIHLHASKAETRTSAEALEGGGVEQV